MLRFLTYKSLFVLVSFEGTHLTSRLKQYSAFISPILKLPRSRLWVFQWSCMDVRVGL